MIWRRAIVIWLLIMAVETLNGGIRELLVAPALGDITPRQISFVTGGALILSFAWLTAPWLSLGGLRMQLYVGFLWAVLTVLFELVLGNALGLSWERMASDYNVVNAGMMSIGLLVMLLAPAFGVWAREPVRTPAS